MFVYSFVSTQLSKELTPGLLSFRRGIKGEVTQSNSPLTCKHQEHLQAAAERILTMHTQNFLCHILQLQGSRYFAFHLYHSCLMGFDNAHPFEKPGKCFFPAPSLQNLFLLFCLDNLIPGDQVIRNSLLHLLL